MVGNKPQSRKAYKSLTKFLEKLGYEYESTNSKHFETWTREDSPPVKVNENIQEQLGMTTKKDAKKRNAQQVNARQANERERAAAEAARARAEYDELVREREEVAHGLSQAEWRAYTDLIEEAEREFRKWDRIMKSAPLANRAKHVA